MHQHERYQPGSYPPVLLERIEVERQSPVNVRYRRYDGVGNLLENRAATAAETELGDSADDDAARFQARADFLAGVNALPGADPLKAILRNLIKAQRWE